MKQDLQRIFLAMMLPLFLIFILYIIKVLEVGMDWDFSRLGVYPREARGVFGIFAPPFRYFFFHGVYFIFIEGLPHTFSLSSGLAVVHLLSLSGSPVGTLEQAALSMDWHFSYSLADY